MRSGKRRITGKGKKSIHFNGSEKKEFLLRKGISVNQLSVYGAAADLCRKLSKISNVSGTPDANEY